MPPNEFSSPLRPGRSMLYIPSCPLEFSALRSMIDIRIIEAVNKKDEKIMNGK